jgi:hypothetical protein
LKAYLGHEAETLHYPEKKIEVKALFQNNVAAEWLRRIPVRWVIFGPYEREFAPDFQAGNWLFPVYQNETVSIYEVN